jgi:hypothetical protein
MIKLVCVFFIIFCAFSSINCQDTGNQTDFDSIIGLYLHIIQHSNQAIEAEKNFIQTMLDLKAAGAKLVPTEEQTTGAE